MRWHRLFDDLEAQLALLERRELAAEVAEHTRATRGELRLLDRLAADLDRPVQLWVAGAGRLEGQLLDVGTDWLLLEGRTTGAEVVVPAAALRRVGGLSGRADARPEVASRRFDLRRALRAVSRDRAQVRLTDVDGERLTGTIDAVLADHLDLAEHAEGVPRRDSELRGRVSVPYAALGAVRRF